MAIEEIVGIEEFAEITTAHFECWNSKGVRIGKDVTHPFLPPVPENLGLVRIEVVRDVEGAADVVAKLVVVNGSRDTGGCRNRIALPGIGIEDRIANIFIRGAMEIPRTSLGGDANLATGRPAV